MRNTFENIMGKEKMLVTSIFFFSNNVFYSPINRFCAKFILSSANALNLDQSKILSFGKRLNEPEIKLSEKEKC